jgi:hypothetical protein
VRLLENLWIALAFRAVDGRSCAFDRCLEGSNAHDLLHGSAAGEEVLQQCAAFVLEDAAAYVDAMVQSWVAYDIEE